MTHQRRTFLALPAVLALLPAPPICGAPLWKRPPATGISVSDTFK